jgi:hypothetical protein
MSPKKKQRGPVFGRAALSAWPWLWTSRLTHVSLGGLLVSSDASSDAGEERVAPSSSNGFSAGAEEPKPATEGGCGAAGEAEAAAEAVAALVQRMAAAGWVAGGAAGGCAEAAAPSESGEAGGSGAGVLRDAGCGAEEAEEGGKSGKGEGLRGTVPGVDGREGGSADAPAGPESQLTGGAAESTWCRQPLKQQQGAGDEGEGGRAGGGSEGGTGAGGPSRFVRGIPDGVSVVLQRLWPQHCVAGSPGADLDAGGWGGRAGGWRAVVGCRCADGAVSYGTLTALSRHVSTVPPSGLLAALPCDLIVRKGTRREVRGGSDEGAARDSRRLCRRRAAPMYAVGA